MRLVPVLAARLPWVWPTIGAMLDRACRRPGCDETETSLLLACLGGRAQAVSIEHEGWIVAAGVTQVRETPAGRACWILALAGTARGSWRDVIAEIEAGAARVGCATVEFIGRPGWRRVHPDYAAESCEAGIHFRKHLRAA